VAWAWVVSLRALVSGARRKNERMSEVIGVGMTNDDAEVLLLGVQQWAQNVVEKTMHEAEAVRFSLHFFPEYRPPSLTREHLERQRPEPSRRDEELSSNRVAGAWNWVEIFVNYFSLVMWAGLVLSFPVFIMSRCWLDWRE